MSAHWDAECFGRVDALLRHALELAGEARTHFLSGLDPPSAARVARLLAAAEAPHDALADALDARIWRGLADDLAAGERFGAWRALGTLAHGGMARVLLAERADGAFQQLAAIKCPWPGIAAGLAARFEQERQILARLEDARIARLLDGGVRGDGTPWLALEYVDGTAITTHCDERRLALAARLALWSDAAAAVAAAHRQLIIHRDLKPANVLVSRDGAVKLLDFGIAKLLDPEGFPHAAPATLADARALTREYASPEQLRGDAVTTASDVYQLGLLLLELATGAQPYRNAGTSAAECERRIREDEPPAASTLALRGARAGARAALRGATPKALGRRLRGDFDAIVRRALAKAAGERYATVDALREDVAHWCAGRPVRARRGAPLQRARQWLRRHRVLALGIGAVAAMGAAWLYAVVSQSQRLAQEAAINRALRDYLVGWFQAADPGDMKSNDPRASQMLADGLANARRDLDAQPELQAAVIGLIGEVYMARGEYALAEPPLREALALHASLPDLAPEWRGASKASLATLLHYSGRYADAEVLFRDALDDRVAAIGETARWTLSTRHAYGDLLHSRGRYDEADAQLARALDGARATVGEADPLVPAIARNLADVRRDAGRYDEAEALYRAAIAAQLTAHGETHPNTIASRLGYARLLLDVGRYDEAAAQAEPAFARLEQAFGTTSPAVTDWERVVAELDEARGAYDDAARRVERIDADLRGRVPDGHLIHGYTALDAGFIALAHGDAIAAARHFARARRVFDGVQPLGHPRRIEVALGEALVARRRGEPVHMLALLAAAQAQAAAQLAPEHRLFAALAIARDAASAPAAPPGLAPLRVQRALDAGGPR
ncbi:MAG: protein kinase domain-containing protein [Dokdonella sp.]|uniref:serine/threonine protein kinase n=1 Tax=Dokdonella sp. TaxID=2291710 RepID=UPI003F7EA08A